MLKIATFKASCSQTIINIVVKVVVRFLVSTSYVCNYLQGLSENNRKCCSPVVVSYSPLYIPTANQKPQPSDIKEKPVLLKFETHAQCLSLQLHITLSNELNAMGNVT